MELLVNIVVMLVVLLVFLAFVLIFCLYCLCGEFNVTTAPSSHAPTGRPALGMMISAAEARALMPGTKSNYHLI